MKIDAFLLRSDRLKALVAERDNLEAERARQSTKLVELTQRVANLVAKIKEAWSVIQSDVGKSPE
jgi:cell division protein FtsB